MNKRLFYMAIAAVSFLLEACTNQPQVTSETDIDLNWCTFNIRYDEPNDSLNNWKYRKDTVASFIKAQDLDVIGMQEVLHHQLNDMLERLPEYAAIGVGRDDGATKGEYSCLLYKKDRFDVLESNTFWLSQYPDSIGFIGWDGACPRIATWAKFQDKETGKIFMAVNTHFDHVGVEARKNSALMIIDKIKEIVGDQPAVVTGDFNINDQDEAYETITTNEFVLLDSYKTSETVEGVNYTYHGWGKAKDDFKKIDFIFITPNIKAKKTIIPEEPKTEWGFISDHNPVVTSISF
ncbi:MAG: endonuclease/exonuclease/phosphatase family protein [Bacteroidaceae bacterium]|nr:endonuclease/exonuclease/phosphatase family protein [Bacteroidaceae bacterium]